MISPQTRSHKILYTSSNVTVISPEERWKEHVSSSHLSIRDDSMARCSLICGRNDTQYSPTSFSNYISSSSSLNSLSLTMTSKLTLGSDHPVARLCLRISRCVTRSSSLLDILLPHSEFANGKNE